MNNLLSRSFSNSNNLTNGSDNNILARTTTTTTMLLSTITHITPQIRLREISWTFIFPVICAIGVCTQSMNIIVFVRLKKDRLNKYCLVHSISYFFYTLICMFSFFIRCGSLCNHTTSSTYIAKVFEQVVFGYVTSVLAIFSIMIETRLSFERYIFVCTCEVCGLVKQTTIYMVTKQTNRHNLVSIFNHDKKMWIT